MSDPKEVIIYEPDTSLKARVGKAGIMRLSNILVIQEAERVVLSFGHKILKELAIEVSKIEKILALLKRDNNLSTDSIRSLVSSAFFIKSNAGFCDYPLISAMGRSLYLFCETCRKKGKVDSKEVTIIGWHIESIKVIMDKQIKAMGGTFGKELLIQLEKFKDKFVDKTITG